MHIAAISIFPEMFGALTARGITGRAIGAGLLRLCTINPRDYARNRHRSVDDRPYGGGAGMVMLFQPLCDAIRRAREELGGDAHVVYLSPQGRRLNQRRVRELGRRRRLVLLCGRYEGVDERLIDAEVNEELSIGDYVLSGGELAAMVVIEALTRCLPGALGHEGSAVEESFEQGRLDCPYYSRPEEWEGRRVPEVLLRGNHAEIRRWRLRQSLGRTWLRRPDLIEARSLDTEERALLAEFKAERSALAGPAALNTASTLP